MKYTVSQEDMDMEKAIEATETVTETVTIVDWCHPHGTARFGLDNNAPNG